MKSLGGGRNGHLCNFVLVVSLAFYLTVFNTFKNVILFFAETGMRNSKIQTGVVVGKISDVLVGVSVSDGDISDTGVGVQTPHHSSLWRMVMQPNF